MAELKTKKNRASVEKYLRGIEDSDRRRDARAVVRLMKEVTGEAPAMWGTSMIGFGSYRYRYSSGREGEWMLTGLAPRKQALSIYIMDGFADHADTMKKLGRYRTGKSCLYVRRLEDIDLAVLRDLVAASVDNLRGRYG